jgi:hypothetical protein
MVYYICQLLLAAFFTSPLADESKCVVATQFPARVAGAHFEIHARTGRGARAGKVEPVVGGGVEGRSVCVAPDGGVLAHNQWLHCRIVSVVVGCRHNADRDPDPHVGVDEGFCKPRQQVVLGGGFGRVYKATSGRAINLEHAHALCFLPA